MPARVGRIGGLIAIVVALACTTTAAIATSARVAHAADAAGSVKLTRVTTLGGTTAMAARTGDATLYVTEQAGRVRAIRNGKLVARPVLDLQERHRGERRAGPPRARVRARRRPPLRGLHRRLRRHAHRRVRDERAGRRQVVPAEPARRRATAAEPQRRSARVRARRRPLYRARRRRRVERRRPGPRQRRERSVAAHAPREDPADRSHAERRRALHGPGGQSVRRTPTTPAPRSGRTGSATRGGSRSTPTPAICGSATSGRTSGKRSTSRPPTAGRNAGRGDNFGWNRLEGTHEFRGNPPANAVPPVYEQSHDDGACSVTGGFVYRGTAIPALAGSYVFTDYCDGTLRTLTSSGNGEYRRRRARSRGRERVELRPGQPTASSTCSPSHAASTSSSPADRQPASAAWLYHVC